VAVRYHIAIVGAGPAGLSAAGRAAHYDAEAGVASPGYILLEGFSDSLGRDQRSQYSECSGYGSQEKGVCSAYTQG
jgi:NADPH-dependent 2,4-dienoyl-CoA reductase/sulfur reductase-like enzyme